MTNPFMNPFMMGYMMAAYNPMMGMNFSTMPPAIAAPPTPAAPAGTQQHQGSGSRGRGSGRGRGRGRGGNLGVAAPARADALADEVRAQAPTDVDEGNEDADEDVEMGNPQNGREGNEGGDGGGADATVGVVIVPDPLQDPRERLERPEVIEGIVVPTNTQASMPVPLVGPEDDAHESGLSPPPSPTSSDFVSTSSEEFANSEPDSE